MGGQSNRWAYTKMEGQTNKQTCRKKDNGKNGETKVGLFTGPLSLMPGN